MNPGLGSPWTKGSGGGGIDAVITAGSLGVVGLPLPVGNSVTLSGAPTSSSVVDRVSVGASGPVTSGTLYYSLILRVTDTSGLLTTGSFIAGFNNSAPAAASPWSSGPSARAARPPSASTATSWAAANCPARATAT
ncbi:MAG: hypothetical protein HY718_05840, partial [Planctomycetes bacterium]|nr:hypothetical protein [Planctomycetota bacterium]